MDLPRVERIFRLMRLMAGNTYYTIEELAKKLDITERSIYRYIDTLKALGFVVDKIHGNVFRLVKAPSSMKDLDKMVYFSDEEAKIVCSLIENLDSTNTLKAALYRKLAVVYDLTSITEFKESFGGEHVTSYDFIQVNGMKAKMINALSELKHKIKG